MEMRRFMWNLLEVPDDETILFQKVTGRDVFKLNNTPHPYPVHVWGKGKLKGNNGKRERGAAFCSLCL